MKLVVYGLLAGILSVAPLAAAESETGEIEKKRVVVRVNVGDADQEYRFVYVDHDDGEPVILDSFFVERGYLGVSLLELTPELRQHFGADAEAGIMISGVDDDGPAFKAGLQAGDVLVAIDSRRLTSSAEFVEIVSAGSGGQAVRLDVMRDRRSSSFEATLETRERRQVDLRGLILTPDRPGHRGGVDWHSRSAPRIELDPEVMNRALSRMRKHFEGQEWRRQLDPSVKEQSPLERRIQELEQRLKELETELEELEEPTQ